MATHRLALVAAAVLAGALAAHEAHAARLAVRPRGTALALPAVTVEMSSYPVVTRYDAIRHRPRRMPYRESRSFGRADINPYFQVHGGVFDPDDAADNHWLLGFRAGQSYDAVQLGVAADWSHRAFDEETVVAETVDPSGHVITESVRTLRTSSNLVPMMGFIQVMAPANLPVRPYFGLGGGYEALFLNSEDFRTGEEHSGTFGGWGWQAWGGAAVPMGPRTALTGEVFVNDATVRRDLDRFETGMPVRESVDVGGVGARVGLKFGF